MNAINKYVVVEEKKEDNTTESGIISSAETKTTYIVTATTDDTKELQGKQVYIKDSYKLEDDLLSVHIDNILAWK